MAKLAVITCVTVAVVLAGCGGGSGDDKPASAATTTPTQAAATQAAAATTTETTETTATAEPAKAGGLTPMGSTLKIGAPAVIAYDDASNHKKSRIEITPERIEKGTLDDFKNIKLEGNQKTSTPYYLTVKVSNVGKGDLSGTDPAGYADGIDDRDQEQNEIIFFGQFDRCNGDKAKSLKPGESYTSCLAFLIPKGGSLKGVRWIAFDEKSGKSNIDWK
jgi:hypothetical protein